MLRLQGLFQKPKNVPMLYRQRLGNGRTVSVVVSDSVFELDNLVVVFERKIESGDVEEGRLRPIAIHEVKKRGGKRSTTMALTYETAEALHQTLGTALRDARCRHSWHSILRTITVHFHIISGFRDIVEPRS